MNTITLRGVLRNIRPSHTIKDIEFSKAEMLVKRADGKEDVLNVRFKKFSNPYTEGQEAEFTGNIRSYSQQIGDKNKVEIYVFTYFDKPENETEDELEKNNIFHVSGRICKTDGIRKTANGKVNVHFILANNLIVGDNKQKLNSYLPCIAWGKFAKEIGKLNVNDEIEIRGELHSREYKKTLENGEIEVRIAHELLVTEIISYNEL